MSDYAMQKMYQIWWNREPVQFFQDKDSNTMTAIYLSYYRVGVYWEDYNTAGLLKQRELLETPNVKTRAISSQASQECDEGSETRRYNPDRMMNSHERAASEYTDDDIVRTAMRIVEESDKELVR